MWEKAKEAAMWSLFGAAAYWSVYVLPLRIKGWWRDRRSSRR